MATLFIIGALNRRPSRGTGETGFLAENLALARRYLVSAPVSGAKIGITPAPVAF